MIGIMPEPTLRADWTAIETYLTPAAILGRVNVLDEHEEVWTVHRDGELIAAATGRLTEDELGEIILCGGRGASEWARPLADRMCDWFRDEGMIAARIYGRPGWKRILTGWTAIGGSNGFTWFERPLT